MRKISKEIIKEIPFYDVDPMYVVWHGNYVKYCEIARSALLEEIGYNYKEMKDEGIIYPIAKMEMKFIKSVTVSQKIKLKATLEEYEPAMKIKYEFRDYETNELIFKAQTMQICVDTKTNQSLYNAPLNFKNRIEKCEKAQL